MNKLIPIKTNLDKFFREYLEVINPLMNLTSREMDVLAELLYFNNKYKHLESEIRNKIIFDYDTRMEIASRINISEASLNNNLSYLKKRGVIKHMELSPIFLIYPDKEYSITFKFDIYGSEVKEDNSGSVNNVEVAIPDNREDS